MGYPMTPSPINATFAIVSSCPSALTLPICNVVATASVNGALTGSAPSLWWPRNRQRWSAMAATKQQVLDGLAKIPAPDGRPLPESGALSDVVVSDGKVFF